MIFLSVTTKIKGKLPSQKIRFAWIGSGYDPESDFNVSLWLEDQIKRAGMEYELTILDHSKAYGELIKRADLFLITSRLDPLPNVGIDAMLEGTPVFCFKKACGLANLLMTNTILEQSLVAEYLDINKMANMAVKLIENNELKKVSEIITERAKIWFVWKYMKLARI